MPFSPDRSSRGSCASTGTPYSTRASNPPSQGCISSGLPRSTRSGHSFASSPERISPRGPSPDPSSSATSCRRSAAIAALCTAHRRDARDDGAAAWRGGARERLQGARSRPESRAARHSGLARPGRSRPRERVAIHASKPRVAIRAELNSFTVSKAWPADDAPGLVARYEEAIALVEPALIMVQEVIPGGGEAQLSFAALCRDGHVVASLTARRTRQWPMDFGRASTYVETIDAPDVERIARRILNALRFDGIVEVEFKRDPRDGALKLLDINPRVWGWHSLGRAAGVDFPYLLWRLLRGEQVDERRGRAGVRWVRALTDLPVSIGEIRAGRMTMREYLASLRGPMEFAILAADDPLPAVVEIPSALHLAWLRRMRDRRTVAARPAPPVPTGAPSGSCLRS